MAFPEITTLDKKNHELYEKALKENMRIVYQLFINEKFVCLVEELKESGWTVLEMESLLERWLMPSTIAIAKQMAEQILKKEE